MGTPVRPGLGVEELRAQLDDALGKLELVGETPTVGIDAEKVDAIVSGLHATALALSASMGECRQETPFSPMRPVLDASGTFKWCCNHASEHCGR